MQGGIVEQIFFCNAGQFVQFVHVEVMRVGRLDVDASDGNEGARVFCWIQFDCAVFDGREDTLAFRNLCRHTVDMREHQNAPANLGSLRSGAAVMGKDMVLAEFNGFDVGFS